MKKARIISASALGKHIGHAVEGHARGIFRLIFEPIDCTVIRKLPIDFPVNPDVVVVDKHQRLRCLGIIAYARDSKGTDKKFYRTRLEYREILRAWTVAPSIFSDEFVPIIIIYGEQGGWKDEIIKDLEKSAPPTIFLPNRLGGKIANSIVEDAYEIYRNRWEKRQPQSREFVEDYYSNSANITDYHQQFKDLVALILAEPQFQQQAQEATKRLVARPTDVRVPSPFSHRIRQGLSLASLFSNGELSAWISSGYRVRDAENSADYLEAFIRKSRFLDLSLIVRKSSLLGKFYIAEPRKPTYVTNDGRVDYAPHRPDFDSWSILDNKKVLDILSIHRTLPDTNPSTFKAGALDQVFGNWKAFSRSWTSILPALIEAIRLQDEVELTNQILNDICISAEDWQPSVGRANMLASWSILTAAIAYVESNRSIHGKYKLRRDEPISTEAAKELAVGILATDTGSLLEIVQRLIEFCEILMNGNLEQVLNAEQPALLSLTESGSWIAACYIAAVTNPSHNPLNVPAYQWLIERYPTAKWFGWPNKRSEALRNHLTRHGGRVQWQFVGVNPDGHLILAEVKSITANHWGDKSKEIYDRVSESRFACRKHGRTCTIIGVLDGDLSSEAIGELSTGRGYDQTFSILEVIDGVSTIDAKAIE